MALRTLRSSKTLPEGERTETERLVVIVEKMVYRT